MDAFWGGCCGLDAFGEEEGVDVVSARYYNKETTVTIKDLKRIGIPISTLKFPSSIKQMEDISGKVRSYVIRRRRKYIINAHLLK